MTSRTLTLPLLITALLLITTARATAQEPAPDTRGASRPGWTLALGSVRTHLIFDDQDQLFSSGPVDISESGQGGFLEAGYAFTSSFALQLRMSGAEHDTGDVNRTAIFGQIQLEAVAHLTEHGLARPYLAGGLGGAFLGIEESNSDTRFLVGGSSTVGGGVEFFLSERWALSFDYRFGLENFENEVVEIDGSEEEVAVDRSTQSHTLQTRVAFSF